MSLIQFAVASIVDANTGNGLVHNEGRIDYAAAAQRGRTIRSKSIIALYSLIKDNLGNAFSNYRERAAQRRQLVTLAQLDDHLLKDIGLSRGDVIAVELGQVTLEQLDAQRRSGSQDKLPDLTTVDQIGQQSLQLDAVNEAVYIEAKCA
jgi:uncharacterized protein YjiS (DUF1127 family)